MTSWPTKKLGETCEIIPPGVKEFEGSKKYIATADVDFDKIVNFTEITYKNRPIRANIEVKENDILVARMAETKKFLMADKNLQNNYIFSTGFAALRVKEELIPKYLFYFLTTKDFNLQKDKLAVGATQKAINNPALKKIKIPIPPLKIQQKIVKRLDAIKKAQKLNDEQIELAEELFKSLLHRELDPKGKNWEVKKLVDLAEFLDNQRIPLNEEERAKRKGSYPYYGATGILDWIDDYIFDGEFVLLAEDGGPFFEKDKSVAYRVSGKCWVNNHAHVLKAKKLVDIDFLGYSLMFMDLTSYLTGSTRAKLNKSRAEKIKIPLPPLETQQKIVEKLSAVQEYKKKLLDQKQKLQELFESVLNKSFKGEWVG